MKTIYNEEHEKPFLDYIKAVAILMVIFFHNLETTNITTTFSQNLYFLLYVMHVPAFLLVSGYLFNFSMKKHTLKELILSKSFDLGLVASLWVIILCFFNHCIFRLNNQPFDSLISIVLFSVNEMWYLYFLLFCIVITIILEKIKIAEKVLLWIIQPILIVFFSFYSLGLTKVVTHYFIFYLGYHFGSQKNFCRIWARVIAFIFIIFSCINCTFGFINTESVFNMGWGLIVSMFYKVCGSIFLFSVFHDLCEVFPKINKANCFTRIGRCTIYIYILQAFPNLLYKFMKRFSLFDTFLATIIITLFTLIAYKVIKNTLIDTIMFHPSRLLKNQEKKNESVL